MGYHAEMAEYVIKGKEKRYIAMHEVASNTYSNVKSRHGKLRSKYLNPVSKLDNFLIVKKTFEKILFCMFPLHNSRDMSSLKKKVSNCLKISL